MNDKNIIKWAKLAAIVIYALLTIITCAGVWNYCPEAFVKWCTAAIFVCNGAAAFFLGRRIYNEE